METELTILNWNVGGAKFLEYKAANRPEEQRKLNEELATIINFFNEPSVITLQEIVQWRLPDGKPHDIIDSEKFKELGYLYYPFILIDSASLSSKSKWKKVRENGDWDSRTIFAQGNAFLFKDGLSHFPVWDLTANCMCREPSKSSASSNNAISNNKAENDKINCYVEKVNLESGLYFGDRDTEPRAALVAHFIMNPRNNLKPLDIFIINTHLTTITREREGIPEVDSEATEIRLSQLEVIFRGIVSRYNNWKQRGYLDREKKRDFSPHETPQRHQPLWIIAGDFNFTPESAEFARIQRWNFVDVVPNKGSGTKAKGAGKKASLTVDYIFAGPKFIALNPLITEQGISDNNVSHQVKFSDHYPMYARIPVDIEDMEDKEEDDNILKIKEDDISEKGYETILKMLRDKGDNLAQRVASKLSHDAQSALGQINESITREKLIEELNILIKASSLYSNELSDDLFNRIDDSFKELNEEDKQCIKDYITVKIDKWNSLEKAERTQMNRIFLELTFNKSKTQTGEAIKQNPLNVLFVIPDKQNDEMPRSYINNNNLPGRPISAAPAIQVSEKTEQENAMLDKLEQDSEASDFEDR